METELFENADVKASIYNQGEIDYIFLFITHQSMRSDLWGSHEGTLFICFRISNITAFSCGRIYFRKRSKKIRFHISRIFFNTDKNDAFSKDKCVLGIGNGEILAVERCNK